MSGELAPRPFMTPVTRNTHNALRGMANAALIEQAALRAVTSIGNQAMFSVLEIKRTQQQLELADPAASAELNLIAATVCTAIAASVQRFTSEIG
jgi:hypothetical protein